MQGTRKPPRWNRRWLSLLALSISVVRPVPAQEGSDLGELSGYDNGRDGYEAFVRDDGFVNVPDEYNPIIRFKRYPAPDPAAHRLLEYTLLGHDVEATIIESAREASWLTGAPNSNATMMRAGIGDFVASVLCFLVWKRRHPRSAYRNYRICVTVCTQ